MVITWIDGSFEISALIPYRETIHDKDAMLLLQIE